MKRRRKPRHAEQRQYTDSKADRWQVSLGNGTSASAGARLSFVGELTSTQEIELLCEWIQPVCNKNPGGGTAFDYPASRWNETLSKS